MRWINITRNDGAREKDYTTWADFMQVYIENMLKSSIWIPIREQLRK